MEKSRLPAGFERCAVCGEFNGATEARNLSWGGSSSPPSPTTIVTVSCLCKGVPCQRCKKNLVHRSGSNTYYEASNSVEHAPWFAGMMPCRPCHDLESSKAVTNAPRVAVKEIQGKPQVPDRLEHQMTEPAPSSLSGLAGGFLIGLCIFGSTAIVRSCSEQDGGERPVTSHVR